MMLCSYKLSVAVVLSVVLSQNCCLGSQCTSGFPTVSEITAFTGTTSFRDSSNSRVVRVIPSLTITCSGEMVGLTIAGLIRTNGNRVQYPVLVIGNIVNNDFSVATGRTIPFGDDSGCQLEQVGLSDVYTCTLPTPVAVQNGDIVGISLAPQNRARFRPYFRSVTTQSTTHVCDDDEVTLPGITDLQDCTIITADDQQLLLSIDIQTNSAELSTTPLVTTQPSSTTQAPHTAQTSGSTQATSTTQTLDTPQAPETTQTTSTTQTPDTPQAAETTQTTSTTQTPDTPQAAETIQTTSTTQTLDITQNQETMQTPDSTQTTSSAPATISTPPAITTPTDANTSTTAMTSPSATTAPPAATTATTDGSGVTTQPDTTSEKLTTASSILATSSGEAIAATNLEQRVATPIGAISGAVVAILVLLVLSVVVIAVVLLLVRKRTHSKKAYLHDITENSIHLSNPNYADNPPGSSAVKVVETPFDYEEVDDDEEDGRSNTVQSNKIDMTHYEIPGTNMLHDYCRSGNAGEYENPVATLSNMTMPSLGGILDYGVYVPSQELRKKLPAVSEAHSSHHLVNKVYNDIKTVQYGGNGPTPSYFEESDTYWEPSSIANELYEQLFSKKYREILRPQIQLTSQLGAGQFGTVHKGIWQSPMGAMDVAVKTLHSGAAEEEKVKFLQEAAINGQFRHPNVVQLMGVVTLGEPVMIVLELLSNGDLTHFLNKQRPSPGEILPSNTAKLLLKFCQQVASGMEYLSRKGFVHRDLAARNILVAEDKICKISDFGMSRDIVEDNYYVSHGGLVPIKWTAPEAIQYKKYSTASDVWSYGCVMYEIWSLGHKPFQTCANHEVLKKLEEGYRLPPPPGCSEELYKIIMQCWHPDCHQRPIFPLLVESLSRPDFELLAWKQELLSSNPHACTIGAPLEAGRSLYPALQSVYQRRQSRS